MTDVPAWFERKFDFGFPVELYPNVCVRLLGSPVRVKELVSGVSREVLTAKADGKWSIQEHVGHLADMEPLWLWRVEDFVSGRETLAMADLTNRRTHEANHNRNDLKEILEEFRSARFDLLERLKKLEAGTAESDGGLSDELARLRSRLVQAKRDHQRSADDIGLLEREIRQAELKLRALKAVE